LPKKTITYFGAMVKVFEKMFIWTSEKS
jgi:hypothetical protein